MEKELPSDKWTSNETNLFCEILSDPVNNFVQTLERRGAEKAFNSELFDSTILDLEEVWKMLRSTKKYKKTSKQKQNYFAVALHFSIKRFVTI